MIVYVHWKLIAVLQVRQRVFNGGIGCGSLGRETERERELFKEFKDFSNLRCNRFIKNKKIKQFTSYEGYTLTPHFKRLNISLV
jgi:hypothetical protein